MALVAGYISSSEDEGEKDVSITTQTLSQNSVQQRVVTESSPSTQQAGGKRQRKRSSYSPDKSKRKIFRRRSPWDSWSGDESDSEVESASSSNENKSDENAGEFHDYQELEDPDEDYVNTENSSKFYGESAKDYQGRGFLHPPMEVEVDFGKEPMSFKCYLPKQIIHTFVGHEQGTNALKFLPKSGHLFLSGGNDSIIKIWDLYHDRKCLRDYRGHTRPVKALDFTADGTHFLSASFDQNVKLWDTESGKVLSRFKSNSIPNDVKIHPLKSNEFILGCSNSKIYHYDTRVSEKQGRVQVYDHHLGSILHLRFFPDGSKFISSSEDKTVRIWENQINIPIKQISDTAQHSMPYIDTHPAGNYFCAQSMDNTIYTYNMKPKYRRHPKKSFSGQLCAGYGIGLAFSPDGRYICSGDSKSRVLIWDWTTTNLLKTISIPGNEPVTNVAWNPQETSKVVCSGPTGKIYLLD